MISAPHSGEVALDAVGLVLTVAGLIVTIVQASRARRAAAAARDAAEAVAVRLGDLLLVSTLPQLRSAEADLRFARARNDQELAVRAIVRWREAIADVSGNLTARGLSSKDDDFLIATCTALAHTSEDLLAERGCTVHEAVAKLLREVGDLSVRLGKISAKVLTEAPHVRAR